MPIPRSAPKLPKLQKKRPSAHEHPADFAAVGTPFRRAGTTHAVMAQTSSGHYHRRHAAASTGRYTACTGRDTARTGADTACTDRNTARTGRDTASRADHRYPDSW
ncbi:hypothetical protein PF004_g11202 [Phytophthora fragariae]|uniref:Uncharacterized protein n=1 Tax=Phytophthora fragariae TaxID=53985 RepID=A0A6G0NYQ1_9STRA|nr:hypothetical protein PF004_g11202 [Phytophthora fragariae]